ncbi:Holliday junction branch migration protein RuvA [Candidatus Dojkabacteria bacterium]|nr:Holliday junction branch migration protein RuvA [Candidatus Dojkabacteria bacterium]
MIGYISGKVKFIGDGYLIVNANGVGYKIEVGKISYREEDTAEFFVYTHVREQELRLFGFETSEELSFFERLITVSGVGPKTALILLTELGVGGIIEAIKLNNPKGLKISGVGARTAEKIIVDLKDKVGKDTYLARGEDLSSINIDLYDESIAALMVLGFRKNEIDDKVKKVIKEDADVKTPQDVVKKFLQK